MERRLIGPQLCVFFLSEPRRRRLLPPQLPLRHLALSCSHQIPQAIRCRWPTARSRRQHHPHRHPPSAHPQADSDRVAAAQTETPLRGGLIVAPGKRVRERHPGERGPSFYSPLLRLGGEGRGEEEKRGIWERMAGERPVQYTSSAYRPSDGPGFEPR